MRAFEWGWHVSSASDPRWDGRGDASGIWNAICHMQSYREMMARELGAPPADLRERILQPEAKALLFVSQ